MPRKRTLAKVLIYAILELGALVGVPMRPDEIEQMTRQMINAVEVVRREEEPSGDPPS